MFAACCCSQVEEVDQIMFESATDENALSMKIFEAPPQQAAAPNLLVSQPNMKKASSGGAGAGLVPKLPQLAESEDEYTNFADSVGKGRNCTRLLEATGARINVKYSVDHASRCLVVKTAGLPAQQEVVCRIACIEDIYTLEDGDECFPPQVVESLAQEEKEGLFLIVYTTTDARGRPHEEPVSLCMVEASRRARDDLMEHLKRLSLSS